MADRGAQIDELIRDVVRLRRAERLSDPSVRREITPVRRRLEALVGPTVSRARAARLLGVTQMALDRWIKRGDVQTVLTPREVPEVPLRQLVELIEAVDAARPEHPRALAHVMRARQQQARHAADVERLLPNLEPLARRGHRLAELRSLAYHRLVAERLDDFVLEEARDRVRRWREEGDLHPWYAEEWDRLLRLPLPEVAAAIGADTEPMRALRQTSPFAGALTEQERRLLLDRVAERVGA